MKAKVVKMIATIVVLGIGIAAAYFLVYKPEMARQVAEAKAKEDGDAARARANAAVNARGMARAEAEKERQIKLKLATIGKGEGPIHAYTRQLIDDPGQMDGLIVKIGKEEYDLTYSGNKSDKGAVEKWANHKACILAIVSGYVEYKKSRKHGRRQIRIKKPGEVAYLFVPRQKDSVKLLDIKIYKKESRETEFGQQTATSVDDIGPDYKITFWSGGSLASFEYVWTPAIAKSKKQKK
ncbi:MAG: hypothetical protein AABZ57_07945 [Candidatus Margulisiibacteriota bacterium]